MDEDPRDGITNSLMNQAMSDPGHQMNYAPLDANQLINTGAIRVVRHPDDTTNDPNLYSIVTHWNDRYPGSETPNWPDKPEAYAAAQQDLANPNSGAMYDGKYRQIMWSVGQRGMNPTNY